MKKIRSLTEWSDYFLSEFLPNITQEESDFIVQILWWEGEKRAGFLLAKRLFEDRIEEEEEHPDKERYSKTKGETMDKQINKVKKDLKKGEKDTNKLLKMDKKFDKKLEKCDMKSKKK